MELINYLDEYFYTKQELLNITKVTEHELLTYQQNHCMPKCSYKLNINLKSDSFLGAYKHQQELEYYAKGYCSWVAVIQSLDSAEAVYAVFAARYQKTIISLKQQGHDSNHPKLTSNLNKHIEEEWQHFLNGTYGLCTRSGLPEDIAAKEFSIAEINELCTIDELTLPQLAKLAAAVNLLDSASSLFAPHERLSSSRQRLVNEVRRKYKL